MRVFWASLAVLILAAAVPAIPAAYADDNIPSSDTSSAITTPTEDSTPEESIYPITPERRELLNSYSIFKNIWRFVDTLYTWVMLLVVALTGLSAWLLKIASRVTRKRAVHFLVYLFLFMLVTGAITLPLDFYRGFVVEHQYGLSNQTLGEWFGDQLKGFPVVYIVGVIFLGLLYFIIRRFPRRWWLWFSLGAAPIMIFMAVVAPVVVDPLFNDFQPMQDQQLKTRILDLASRAGIEGSDVFEVDASRQSSRLNAYVTGLFGTKRIVLYDNMIAAFTPEELLFVMGHEMGHYVMNHIWYGVGVAIALLLAGTWLMARILPALIRRFQRRLRFDQLASYASLPLIFLALSLGGFFIQPVTNGLSRHFERQSDKFGMDMTDCNGPAAAVAFEKLSAYNLSDPNPHPFIEFWFYGHPALTKRIAFVEGYRGE